MKSNDMPEFLQIMTSIGVLYNKPINELLIEIYWRTLERFELPAVKNALQAHINNPDTGQFMPKPADIVKLLEGNSTSQALQAWSKVKDAIREVGSYSSIIFDDPLIHVLIIEMGGWIQLCKTQEKEIPFKQREFENRYARYIQVKPTNFPKQLIGITNQINQQNGFALESPILFGNHKQALGVFEQGQSMKALENKKQLLITKIEK